jgi:hypothetical protein
LAHTRVNFALVSTPRAPDELALVIEHVLDLAILSSIERRLAVRVNSALHDPFWSEGTALKHSLRFFDLPRTSLRLLEESLIGCREHAVERLLALFTECFLESCRRRPAHRRSRFGLAGNRRNGRELALWPLSENTGYATAEDAAKDGTGGSCFAYTCGELS